MLLLVDNQIEELLLRKVMLCCGCSDSFSEVFLVQKVNECGKLESSCFEILECF